MATLLLGALGSALGSSLLPTGLSVFGKAIAGDVIGRAIGGAIGRSIDQRLITALSPATKQEGPRLETLDLMTSQEGAALPEISGRAAVAGEVIWATKLKEVAATSTQKVGSGKNKQKVQTTNYSYFASFAISLGEGPLSSYGRIWANGKIVDLGTMISEGRVRFYSGTEAQMPDPLIDAIEGGAPAYRGTAYIVFEEMALEDFGNSVPQIKVEVYGPSGEMETLVRGVNLIPGSTEWGYMPSVVNKEGRDSQGNITYQAADNAVRFSKVADWKISLDQLDATLTLADTVSLVVAWFGTDLRAGLCEIEPRVELRDKDTDVAWGAAGLTRATANLVSTGPNARGGVALPRAAARMPPPRWPRSWAPQPPAIMPWPARP
jgi:hypothetical protein